MISRLGKGLLWASLFAVCRAVGQPGGDLVDSILRPSTDPRLETPVPLRPAAPAVRRPPPPRLPPFGLKTGDRVLLLGDSLFAREAELGYLETRLVSQSPAQQPVFRHLSWYTNTPLAAAPAERAPTNWLEGLLTEAARVKPTVVFLGYGTDLSTQGEAGVPAFRRNCEHLREGLRTLDTNVPVRFVWFTPVFLEHPTSPPANPDPQNVELMRYAQAVYEIATNHQDHFVAAIEYLRISAAMAAERGKTSTVRMPRQNEDGLRLTPFGYSRVVLAMERALRWPANNWRFGLLANGTLREGGFGAEVAIQKRTDEGAKVTVLEERLPAPNPSGFVDRAPDTKPQCYIQIPGLKPGPYELRVDGQPVALGSESDWGRYVVIAEGPSWDQAEALRQAIVAKNASVTERWRTLSAAADGAAGARASEVLVAMTIGDREAEIQRLQQPVRREYEIARVGSSPPPPARPAANPPATVPPAESIGRRQAAPPPPPPPPLPPQRP